MKPVVIPEFLGDSHSRSSAAAIANAAAAAARLASNAEQSD
jgi:hypothetical protein